MSTLSPLNVLILEDQAADAELMLDELRQAGFEPEWERVQTKAEYLAGLTSPLDVILADHTLPQFDGLTALMLLQERGLDVPFIIVSGSIPEELAVSILMQGAADYILKDRLTRLGQAVRKALADKQFREGHRKTQEELKRLKDFNENIVQTMTEGVVISDADGILTFVNPAAAAMVGLTPAEVIGLSLQGTKLFVPADQHDLLDIAIEQRKLEQFNSRYEMDISTRDGFQRSLLISSSPRFEEGRFAGTLAVLTDMTEQKRTERELQKLHLAIEQSGSSVVITDLQGIIEYVNPKFTAVTGYTADEVIGKNPRILKTGETPPQVYKQLWDTIAAGDEWRGEFHNRKKNGELFWELASISPVKDKTGRIINFLAVKEDITERKSAEEEIRSLAKFPSGESPTRAAPA